jgi:ESS family glutamate:Na+ symporter
VDESAGRFHYPAASRLFSNDFVRSSEVKPVIELQDGVLHIGAFLTVTIGIIVLFVGKRLNDGFAVLRELSIPEPVTGGLLFSVLFGLVYAASGIAVDFHLDARDVLLV